MKLALLSSKIGQESSKYEVHKISFLAFLVQAFKIVIVSWKFGMLLLYML